MKLVMGLMLSLGAAGCLSPGIHPGDPGLFDGGVPIVEGDLGFAGPQPTFGPTTKAATPPPALSGGTLLVLAGGKSAVAADPDRDQLYIVDLTAPATLRATIALNAGDEPGRAVADAAGHVHVVARRGGVVVTIDPAAASVIERKQVCPAPRGIAYEANGDRVHVACAGGELVTLPAVGGDPVRTLRFDRDLRDVVVAGGRLFVSTFRKAEILIINADGTLATRTKFSASNDFGTPATPSVAWRMMALPDGRVGVAHQRGITGSVQTTHGGYGGPPGGCGGIVESAFGIIDSTTFAAASATIANGVLPVDFAVSPLHGNLAILSSANAHTANQTQVTVLPVGNIVIPGGPPDMGGGGGGGCEFGNGIVVQGEAIAVAFDPSDRLWVQTREPATLQRFDGGTVVEKVTLSTDSRADTGWAVFHSSSGAQIACASCHPEGGDDARIWTFDKIGPRRTQTLRGHVGGTEPFHWNGELANFDALVKEVYNGRMAGPFLDPSQQQALFDWVNAIPTLPQSPPADAAAVARGQTLFQDTTHAACATCHAGPQLTNNQTVDVGTGGTFQVPRLLGVGWRAPFLHDGCAATLSDRFGACGGGDHHGVTSSLTAAQIADLVAYLETL